MGGGVPHFILSIHYPERYSKSFLFFFVVQVVQVNFVYFRVETLSHFSLEAWVVTIIKHFELEPSEESHHHCEHDCTAEAYPCSNPSFTTDVEGRSWGSK